MPQRRLTGWIRLWIVVSVAWAAFAIAHSYRSATQILATKEYKIEKEGVGGFTVLASEAQSKNEVEDLIRDNIVPRISGKPELYVGKTFDEVYKNYVDKALPTKWLEIAMLVLLPPLGLLGIGFAVCWVYRGFRA
jgi:hypothetical protein